MSSSQKRQRRNRRLLLLGVVAVLLFGCYLGAQPVTGSLPEPPSVEVPESFTAAPVAEETDTSELIAESPPVVPDNIITRAIQSGDNLSAIFGSIPISQTVLHQVLAADEALLALDVLYPGNRLTFTLDETTRELQQMELFIHPGKQIVYRCLDDGSFVYEEIINPGIWEQELITGEINGSFYLSAMRAGLTEQETVNIAELFRSKLNFSRDMRAGDRFQVIRKQQFVDGEYTGQSLIEGIRIFNQKLTYTGFLFEDGNYYDSEGESLASAFRRYPFEGNYRISSSFNLKRKHPVTGKISPHLGTDFAMSTGTPVLATGDGVVTRVKNHLYAGKYIEIQHSGQYVTRYLHLSKILVKNGQKVTRGQKIALSGNTGRTTGAHLHYELRIKGTPVNAITAKIPMASAIPDEKRQLYKNQVAGLLQVMEVSHQQVAQLPTQTDVTSETKMDTTL
jgi:murein DD-endopeptidase